jgi:hypothetical protein
LPSVYNLHYSKELWFDLNARTTIKHPTISMFLLDIQSTKAITSILSYVMGFACLAITQAVPDLELDSTDMLINSTLTQL